MELAQTNPRANLQNFKYKGATDKLQEMLEQDFGVMIDKSKGMQEMKKEQDLVRKKIREQFKEQKPLDLTTL